MVFDPSAAQIAGNAGHELLSNLQIEHPVAVAVMLPHSETGFFIEGSVQYTSDNSDDTINVTVVVEAPQEAFCWLWLTG